MTRLFVLLAIGASVSITAVHAQKPDGKTLLQQLEEEEEKERRKNMYQGQSVSATQSVQKARENAKADVNSCPPGSTRRTIEDVRVYLQRQEDLQQKLASSLEKFTTRAIDKNPAIVELNQLINESNEIVIWGRGRVTDGACGPTKQTEIIGKAINATKALIDDYKRAVQ